MNLHDVWRRDAWSQDLDAAELLDSEDFDDADDFEDAEDFLDRDDGMDMVEVLRDALHEDYSDCATVDMEAALDNVFAALSPAESLNLAKVMKQIERGATRVLSNPTAGQVIRTGAPIAGGALGTFVGGPAGTALGSTLGAAAVRALPKSGSVVATASTTPRGSVAVAPPHVVNGSAAAAQALVLTQQPDVLKGLLALALGAHGRDTVNGVPVGTVVNLLGSIFSQAAADADALQYHSSGDLGRFARQRDSESWNPSSGMPPDHARALYEQLIDADNALIEDELRW